MNFLKLSPIIFSILGIAIITMFIVNREKLVTETSPPVVADSILSFDEKIATKKFETATFGLG